MYHFLFLFSVVSLQLSAYKENNWSSFEAYQPSSSVYGFSLEEARSLKNDTAFEKALAARLSSLSVKMKKRADELRVSEDGTAFVGFSHAFIISLSYFLPLAAKEVTQYENAPSILGAIDEAREYFAENYPLSMELIERSPKSNRQMSPEERALSWFLNKGHTIKHALSDKFKTNILDMHQPALPRVIALILIAQLESDEFYYDCFLSLYFEFFEQITGLSGCPSEVHLMKIFNRLSKDKKKASVFLKTSLVGEAIAKTIINSVGDLTDETMYKLADLLYPASYDFITHFNSWLNRSFAEPAKVKTFYTVTRPMYCTTSNYPTLKPKPKNLIDSEKHFKETLGKKSLKFNETMIIIFQQAFDGQDLKRLFALLLCLNEAFDLKINHPLIENYKKQAESYWKEQLSSFNEELEKKINQEQENAYHVASDEELSKIRRLFLLKLFCQDNNFSDIFAPMVENMEKHVLQELTFPQFKEVLKKEKSQEKSQEKSKDDLFDTLVDTFLFYL